MKHDMAKDPAMESKKRECEKMANEQCEMDKKGSNHPQSDKPMGEHK